MLRGLHWGACDPTKPQDLAFEKHLAKGSPKVADLGLGLCQLSYRPEQAESCCHYPHRTHLVGKHCLSVAARMNPSFLLAVSTYLQTLSMQGLTGNTKEDGVGYGGWAASSPGVSCSFCAPAGKRIHPQLFPEAKLNNGALPRLLKEKQGWSSMCTGVNLRKKVRNSHLSSCMPLLGPKTEWNQQN